MLVAIGDTHRADGHGLAGRTLEAVRAAAVVCHTGDFTTAAVYEAIAAECRRLYAVAGNNDETDLTARLPARSVFRAEGVTVALVHGHEHMRESLALLGHEVGAQLVVSGHTHRPGVEHTPGCTLLNPGSHAAPRWYRPAHAELDRGPDGLDGRLVEPDGTVIERFSLAADAE